MVIKMTDKTTDSKIFLLSVLFLYLSIPLYLSNAIILAISTVRILSVIPPDIT